MRAVHLLSQLVLQAGKAQLQLIDAFRAACGFLGSLWQGATWVAGL